MKWLLLFITFCPAVTLPVACTELPLNYQGSEYPVYVHDYSACYNFKFTGNLITKIINVV